MEDPRSLVVLTSSRADAAHLTWPIRALRARSEITTRVLAFGPHLSPRFGSTIRELEADGIEVDERVECLLDSDSDVGMAKSIGVATLGLADSLARLRPDFVLIPADRYEMLAAASVATALRIPVLHLEGGEVTHGAIDNAIRNALTMLASVHFTTTARARDRVAAVGVDDWRIHRVGAPSLDALRQAPLEPREPVMQALGLDPATPTIVASLHSVTLQARPIADLDPLLEAIGRFPELQIAFCYPNADAGNAAIIERVRACCELRRNARLFVNLNPARYWSLLAAASAIVGNSSSGVMESTSLGLPAVDVGDRQKGRERGANVLYARADAEDIERAVREALAMTLDRRPFALDSPYGDGRAGERIADTITGLPGRMDLLRSDFNPAPGTASHGPDHRDA